jgi:hydroxyacylglutathione hydrolase
MKRRKFLANLGGLGIATLAGDIKLLGQTVFGSPNYTIEQFEDKGLAHFSYAVLAGGKVIIIDPQRNPQCIMTSHKSIMRKSLAL